MYVCTYLCTYLTQKAAKPWAPSIPCGNHQLDGRPSDARRGGAGQARVFWGYVSTLLDAMTESEGRITGVVSPRIVIATVP